MQAFTPTLCEQWSANVLEGNELIFFSGLSQNHDYKYIYPNESRKIINESNKAGPSVSRPAWKGLYVGIRAINSFDF